MGKAEQGRAIHCSTDEEYEQRIQEARLWADRQMERREAAEQQRLMALDAAHGA